MRKALKRLFNMLSLYSGSFNLKHAERHAMEEKGWVFNIMSEEQQKAQAMTWSGLGVSGIIDLTSASKEDKTSGSDLWYHDLAEVRGLTANDLPRRTARRLKL